MKFWGLDNPLMSAWEANVRNYFDILEIMIGAKHHHDDRITTKEDAQALRSAFSENFGKDGDKILGKLVTSEELNGGDNPSNPESFFPGMEYSIPLSFYFARRALDTEMPSHAYDIFVNDVMSYAEKNETDIDRVPTRWFIESLAEPRLREINALEPLPEASAKMMEAQAHEHNDDRDTTNDVTPV